MKYYTLIFMFLSIISLHSQSPDTLSQSIYHKTARILIKNQDGTIPMSAQELKNDPNAFQIAIVADRTGGHRDSIFNDAMSKLNLLQPEFVMSVGDLIEGYSENEYVINNEWDQMDAIINQLNMPFFYVPGNHDYSNEVMAEVWKERHGPSYYHFVYKDVLFICLNSNDLKGTGGETQIAWAKKIVGENKDCRWNLIFLHHPLWNTDDFKVWEELEKIFQTGPEYTVIAGHHHHYLKQMRNDHKHFTLATTGAGSKLRGLGFGEFDHVVWLTMNNDGPLIANLLLEGIWDENVVTEQKRLFYTMINDPNNMKVSPIFFEDEINTGKMRMRIANDFDVPLKLNLNFIKKCAFSLDKELPKQLTLEPNSVRILEYQVLFDQPKTTNELIATIEWKAAVAEPEGLEIEIDGDLGVHIAKWLPGPQETKEKKIDGLLDDWNETFTHVDKHLQILGDTQSWNGADDNHYEFAMAYNDAFVYFAIQVFDDQIISDKEEVPWHQDGIELRLDARERSVSASGLGTGQGKDILLIAISPNKNAKDEAWLTHQKDMLPDGIQYVCVENSDGYIAEFAIPVSYFNQKQGTEWKNFRLNICIDDTDDDGFAQLWWQPSWREKENTAGSGMFLKR